MGVVEVVMATPIFQSVEDALFVSFLLGTLPVRGGSTQLQRMMDQALRDAGKMADREPSRISFGGLSPLEVRGQCAMIVACVKDRLPEHEAAAIHARFGYQCEKASGVRGIVAYAGPLLSVGNVDARLAMGWAVFGTEAQRKEITAAAISREWGIVPDTVERDIKKIKSTARRLQGMAVDHLDPMFRRDGVF